MRKKTIAFIMATAACSVFAATYVAFVQNKASASPEQPTSTCSGQKFVLPATIVSGDQTLENYLSLLELQPAKRSLSFEEMTTDEKVRVIQMGLAFELVKRPGLKDDQIGFLVDLISSIKAESLANTSPTSAISVRVAKDQRERATELFGAEISKEILDATFQKKSDVKLAASYLDILKLGSRERKQIVKDLAFDERANIWKVQGAYHLVTGVFNRNQKLTIAGFVQKVPEILNAGLTLTGSEKAKYLEDLEASLFKSFSKAEAYSIFMEIGTQERKPDIAFESEKQGSEDSQGPSPTGEGSSAEFADCNCRWYCDTDGQSCKQISCRVVSYCGPTDTWDCTGRCSASENE